MINPHHDILFIDVDPPRDLTAVNIQTDSATLTWKPPQASVTGYTLTFSSADGIIRVRASSTHQFSHWQHWWFLLLNPKAINSLTTVFQSAQ